MSTSLWIKNKGVMVKRPLLPLLAFTAVAVFGIVTAVSPAAYASGGSGSGKPALPNLITQTYVFDTNADGTTSTVAGTDTICRTDGYTYASTGSNCVNDRFSVDANGVKQIGTFGDVAQPWVDQLNAWNTDPARRATSGKNAGTLSLTCLTNLFVVNLSNLPSQASLNPQCVGN